jgi:L-alanine-DL-glutamate epimerase-like enolase superfamily enzyme
LDEQSIGREDGRYRVVVVRGGRLLAEWNHGVAIPMRRRAQGGNTSGSLLAWIWWWCKAQVYTRINVRTMRDWCGGSWMRLWCRNGKLIPCMVDNLLIGLDPRGVKGLWQRLVDFVFKGNNCGTVTDAISSIDVALWDIKAKANNGPLWKTLGAASRRVKAYASGIDLRLSDGEIGDFYATMAACGISAGKLKVGLDFEHDLRRIQIMKDARARSGKKPVLLVDSNEYWSPKQAIHYIRAYEEHFDITWAEEPARRRDYRGLRKVSQGIKAAVATGHNLDHVSEFTPLVLHEAVDIVEVGWGCSGITGALQVADLAYAFELPLSMINCPAHFLANVAVVLPNHMMMEVVEPGWDQVLQVDT